MYEEYFRVQLEGKLTRLAELERRSISRPVFKDLAYKTFIRIQEMLEGKPNKEG